ncbi:MAG: hypothetical protein LKE64_01715 [Solobacterium sp.]|jgi:tartrate dehydratase beta subunit/fumarate hydratase class I family protein|nr:hypothetical protein [Solobacterium sp.]MCH4049843.1 hypothetical protein [Solobacterium sp.]MCH4073528.1 hypothetical protein [Solobacterium sp.]MCI1314294.1 hypothetical protein [Solobacterium sp.]MCI1346461.1 hypothetical protein [Solobacterium sp.]
MEDYVQLYDGKILMDRDGSLQKLKEEVKQYIESIPLKTEEEKKQHLSGVRRC